MDAKSTAKGYTVIAGPTRSALFAACQYAAEGTADPVHFTVVKYFKEPPHVNPHEVDLIPTADFTVKSVAHINDSGHYFDVSGACRADFGNGMELHAYEGHYDTAIHAGCFFFNKL